MGTPLDHGDLTADTAQKLGQLAGHDPAPQHQDALRHEIELEYLVATPAIDVG